MTAQLNQVIHNYEKGRQNFVGNCVYLRSFYDRFMGQTVLVFWLNGKEVRVPA